MNTKISPCTMERSFPLILHCMPAKSDLGFPLEQICRTHRAHVGESKGGNPLALLLILALSLLFNCNTTHHLQH